MAIKKYHESQRAKQQCFHLTSLDCLSERHVRTAVMYTSMCLLCLHEDKFYRNYSPF